MNTPEDDQHEWIDRARAGEAVAFERLAERHAASLWRGALALCRDSHWAEDLAQETLLEAWRSIARFDGRCRFSTWIYGILRHRYLKGRRRRGGGISLVEAVAEEPDPGASPERVAEASEDARRIRRAVASLPEAHRQVVELRFFADATLSDVAAALDCPLGTVKSRLHHALEKLRRMDLSVNLPRPCRESKEESQR